MRVLLPPFPEPPDQVIANLTIGDSPLGPAFEPWQRLGAEWFGERVLQGEWATSRMPEFPVPRAMIGWNPYFAQASRIGPMAVHGGQVGMVPIGPQAAAPIKVDPVIAALYAQVPQDSTGELYGLGVMLPSQSAPVFDRVLSSNPIAMPTPIAHPRREIADSGLLKVFTVAAMPAEFGRVVVPLYDAPKSYQVFQLTGTTRDGTGALLGNCRVIAYQSGTRYVDAGAKVIAETVSDGSGAFTMLLRNIDYQLVAYKEGSPDLGGVTRQDVTPVVAQTIYLRDPTAASGSGSAVFRPVGSPVVRRIQ